MNECMFKTKSETARGKVAGGPLHATVSSNAATPPSSPGTTFKKFTKNRSSSRKKSTRTSNGTIASTSTRSSTSSRRFRRGDGSFALSDLADQEGTERSDDKSSSSIISGCSSEFRINVTNISMIDNTNAPGTYSGEVDRRTNKPHGQGTMVYEDSIFEGQFIDGSFNGFGVLTEVSTGNSYQGGWYDDKKHGLGVMKYSDGRVYDGVFMLDKLEKKGKLSMSDGTKYWGYWNREGVPHGRGKMEYPDGTVFDGEFDAGLRSGHGRMTYKDGSWFLGEWCDDKPNGLGMQVDATGELIHEGMYSNGSPIAASSMPQRHKSSGQVLLYRSSVTPYGGGTLVGPLPRQVSMRPGTLNWATKNL